MPTRNIAPRANNEGSLGVAKKQWGAVYAEEMYLDGKSIVERILNGELALVPEAVHAAALHNALPRGKDLTEYWKSGEMSVAIHDGSFKDIYVGDYIMQEIKVGEETYNVKWVVAHIDYFWHGDNMDTSEHHLLMIAAEVVQLATGANATATTEGGFIGSKIWTELLPLFDSALDEAFGGPHVLTHSELLTTAVGEDGKASAWNWSNVKSNIPSESMVFGRSVFGNGLEVGNRERQLALFRNSKFSEGGKWFWLSTIATGTEFSVAGKNGEATHKPADSAEVDGGLRPYFLLV